MPSPDQAGAPLARPCRSETSDPDKGPDAAIDPAQITGVVLAGGRGSRMGGLDKGMQLYGGLPLAQHSLRRLQAQVGTVLLNANRNLDQYRAFGAPVVTDTIADFAGPLAGFIAAMENCHTPYLVTVPCDTPQFPVDLVARLAQALARESADIAMASAMEAAADGTPAWFRQPVFCLIKSRCLLTCAPLSQTVAERSAHGPHSIAPCKCRLTNPALLPTPTRWPNCRRSRNDTFN